MPDVPACGEDMREPTEERLRDWMAGLISASPYHGGHFLVSLALAADCAGAEEFTSMLPLLRHHFHLHPEYSYEEFMVARSCDRTA